MAWNHPVVMELQVVHQGEEGEAAVASRWRTEVQVEQGVVKEQLVEGPAAVVVPARSRL